MPEFMFTNKEDSIVVPCRNCRNGIMQVEPGVWSHIGPVHLSCDDPEVLSSAIFARHELYPINRDCPFCRTHTRIYLPLVDVNRWLEDDVYVQVAFPYLDAEYREILINGCCIDCQKELYSGLDED